MTQQPSSLCVYPMRIQPGEDILNVLQNFVLTNDLKAAFIVTCVGSVKRVKLRFATNSEGKEEISDIVKNLEICSLVGTVSKDGCHIHGTFGDVKGVTVSGHVMGNIEVQTTVEIVIGNADGYQFRREFDHRTGFKELVVGPSKPKI
ncbi:Bifunctional protein GlmU [Frankliniella fusca]|uniref:Bifunctional protein GlmU n=1 Tax=Frankliniella fusca TaxID=407009 RepID=A0AAE1LFE5_9NEOP|nr:Bifunctional protein GlmU [Frankliniella fusca]